MSNNPIVPARNFIGMYSETPEYFEPTFEDLKCEAQLSGAFETWGKLDWRAEVGDFEDEIKAFEDKWRDYLPRPDRPNNRYGLLLSGLPGNTCESPASLPEIRRENQDPTIHDIDLNVFTDAYYGLPSLQPIMDFFAPLGRTYLLKMGPGSYFPPHRDDPLLSRKTFRIAGFLGGVEEDNYIWYMDNRRINISPGDFAYVDTRKTHGTAVWNNQWSYHMIMDIPKTWENVLKVMSIAKSF